MKTNMSDCDGCPGDESSVKLSEEDAYLELEKIRQSMTEIQQILSTLKPLMVCTCCYLAGLTDEF